MITSTKNVIPLKKPYSANKLEQDSDNQHLSAQTSLDQILLIINPLVKNEQIIRPYLA